MKNTMSYIFVYVGVFMSLLLRSECLFAGDSCFADDQPGTCSLLSECEPLVAEIRRAGIPLSLNLRKKLQKLNCGYEGNMAVICCAAQHQNQNNMPHETQTESPEDTSNRVNNNNAIDQIDVVNHPNLSLLPISTCGVIESDRIFGGQRTRLLEMPWMVLLSYDTARGRELNCGGTLINEWYVLTAAHCVSFLSKRLTLKNVILGEHDIRTDPDCERVEQEQFCAPSSKNVTIDSIIAHPGYSPQTWSDDIALIRLSEPANFNLESMKAICLPITPELQRESLMGVNGLAAGWGAAENGLQSPVLLSVELPIVDNKDCQALYNRSVQITNNQICAGGIPNKDSCGGDSGGPLMYNGIVGANGDRSVQRGIVSIGLRQCGRGGYPSVYTKVASYMKWILDHMQP